MEKLNVWYGLRKLTPTAVRKPSIVVAFENEYTPRNEPTVNRLMKVLHTRWQTAEELQDCGLHSRTLSVYEIYFLHDKKFNGDIEKAIEFNSLADNKHVSEEERNEIANKIRSEIYDYYNIKNSKL